MRSTHRSRANAVSIKCFLHLQHKTLVEKKIVNQWCSNSTTSLTDGRLPFTLNTFHFACPLFRSTQYIVYNNGRFWKRLSTFRCADIKGDKKKTDGCMVIESSAHMLVLKEQRMSSSKNSFFYTEARVCVYALLLVSNNMLQFLESVILERSQKKAGVFINLYIFWVLFTNWAQVQHTREFLMVASGRKSFSPRHQPRYFSLQHSTHMQILSK